MERTQPRASLRRLSAHSHGFDTNFCQHTQDRAARRAIATGKAILQPTATACAIGLATEAGVAHLAVLDW